MATNKSFMPQLLKVVMSMAAPAPVREVRGAAAYAKNPRKAITPVAIVGRALPREARAILDIWAMTRNKR